MSASAHPPRRPTPHRLGERGERIAAAHLESTGWTVLDRNVRWGRREIDLVIRRDGLLAFVEVKTRSGPGFGPPHEAVTWKKRREIEAVARYYLARMRARDLDVRFDVVAIVTDASGHVVELDHVEDAWRPGL